VQNVTAVSRPGFNALSNGELVLAVGLISCTGKLSKLFTEAVLAFHLPFQHIGLYSRKIKVTIRKSGKSWSRKKSDILDLVYICT
jgi:hypothetical protein